MDKEILKTIEEQQINNYIMAVKELILNNTNALFDLDISAVISKPPLNSMDNIKNKYVEIAKKYHVFVNTNITDEKIESYRKEVLKEIDKLRNFRQEPLINEIDEEIANKEMINLKLSKKNFNDINKKINSQLKKILKTNIELYLIKDIPNFYIKIEDVKKEEKIIKDIEKHFSKVYLKQTIDSINLKIIVKDTILINVIKEQKERYIWTKNNSRIKELQ